MMRIGWRVSVPSAPTFTENKIVENLERPAGVHDEERDEPDCVAPMRRLPEREPFPYKRPDEKGEEPLPVGGKELIECGVVCGGHEIITANSLARKAFRRRNKVAPT